ncbi:MAG: (2Fe-2S)-binding protein [Acidobacteria bacterium]|nr:(2Fe-2S)-binding protein [Acidobacteriota bacterium]
MLLVKPNSSITFTFDGKLISAIPGQTVGSAILEAGERTMRLTRFENKPRGIFCGIGICFDCLVVIDGTPNQRACLIEVRDGMSVNTQVGGAWSK